MIDLLVFIETFIKIGLAWNTDPEHVPVMRISVGEALCLKDWPYKHRLALDEFIRELWVISRCSSWVIVTLSRCIDKLFFCDWLEGKVVWMRWHVFLLYKHRWLPFRSLCRSTGLAARFTVLHLLNLSSTELNLIKSKKHVTEILWSFFFLLLLIRYREVSLWIQDKRGSRSPWVSAVNALPLRFLIGLELEQSLKSWVFVRWPNVLEQKLTVH